TVNDWHFLCNFIVSCYVDSPILLLYINFPDLLTVAIKLQSYRHRLVNKMLTINPGDRIFRYTGSAIGRMDHLFLFLSFVKRILFPDGDICSLNNIKDYELDYTSYCRVI